MCPCARQRCGREISHEAWQIAGSFVLTEGDRVTERGVRPLHNFDFGNGHLGALQVAARYHALFADEEVSHAWPGGPQGRVAKPRPGLSA